MARIMIGSKVEHDYSGYRGVVKAYRRNPQGYNYQVDFQVGPDEIRTDWYQRKVLVLL